MADYIGITMGPIVDTLMLADTPAMLWYASYMFSTLSQKICKRLADAGIEILSPYYKKDILYNDAIGRFHDRIIIKSGDTETVKNCISAAEEEITSIIIGDLSRCNVYDTDGNYKNFMESFYCVHWVKLNVDDNENAIIKLGEPLDLLEQMPNFNANDEFNPIKKLFEGDDESSNSFIRNSGFMPVDPINTTQLFSQISSGLKFKSIPEIAGTDEQKREFKKYSYYAVVKGDGDHMGDFLKTLKNDKIEIFSQSCFKYVEEASNHIKDYGGMTIYAGGDDLLFIAPIESTNDTVFDLCKIILEDFTANFEEANNLGGTKVTLSLGISIRYEKFPLYEAFDSARTALDKAKGTKGKNTAVIDFSKHSGQSEIISVPMEKLTYFIDLIKQCRSTDTLAVQSVIYILTRLNPMFNLVKGNSEAINNILKNQYDNAGQAQYTGYIESIADKLYVYFQDLGNERRICLKDGSKAIDDNERDIKCFEIMLRMGKFLLEKGGNK